jgi:hypothetical protein
VLAQPRSHRPIELAGVQRDQHPAAACLHWAR